MVGLKNVRLQNSHFSSGWLLVSILNVLPQTLQKHFFFVTRIGWRKESLSMVLLSVLRSSSQSFKTDSVWQDEFNLQGSSGDSSKPARTWYWLEQGMLLTTLMSLMSLFSSREDTSAGNSSLLLFLATSGELEGHLRFRSFPLILVCVPGEVRWSTGSVVRLTVTSSVDGAVAVWT